MTLPSFRPMVVTARSSRTTLCSPSQSIVSQPGSAVIYFLSSFTSVISILVSPLFVMLFTGTGRSLFIQDSVTETTSFVLDSVFVYSHENFPAGVSMVSFFFSSGLGVSVATASDLRGMSTSFAGTPAMGLPSAPSVSMRTFAFLSSIERSVQRDLLVMPSGMEGICILLSSSKTVPTLIFFQGLSYVSLGAGVLLGCSTLEVGSTLGVATGVVVSGGTACVVPFMTTSGCSPSLFFRMKKKSAAAIAPARRRNMRRVTIM